MEFVDGRIEGVQVSELRRHVDDRGYLAETWRSDTGPSGFTPAMGYVSATEPGAARGPHEHRSQTDFFAFVGPGNFKVYLWDNRPDSPTRGCRQIFFGGDDRPISILIPPGVVHAYRNISRLTRGWVLNYPDRLYAGPGKKDPVDETRHEDERDEFYQDFVR
jgi:dTDP-4-dehydrorhamnose 3,5-epimerase